MRVLTEIDRVDGRDLAAKGLHYEGSHGVANIAARKKSVDQF